MKDIIRKLRPIFFMAVIFMYFSGVFTYEGIKSGMFEDPITISEYTADITVNSSGDMNVIETWDMTYEEALRVRFRDIKYGKYPIGYPLHKNTYNVAFFDEENVSVQILRDGVDITEDIRIGYSFNEDRDELHYLVDCDPITSYCESIFTDFLYAGGLEGNVTFIYNYTLEGVVTEYSDISEINWVLFEYAENSVESGEVTIHLPSNTNSLSNYHIFSHGIENTTTEIISNDTIKILFEDMGKKDILGFRLLVPTNVFDSVENINKVINDAINKQVILDYEDELLAHAERGKQYEQIFTYLPYGIATLMLIISGVLYLILFKPFKTEFDGAVYRDIPSEHSPAVIGYLYRYKKTVDEDVTATVLDLVRKGYLSLDDSLAFESPDDYALIIVKEDKEDNGLLLAHERHLIGWFIETIGNGKQVTTKQIEDYGKKQVQARMFQAKVKKFKEHIKHESMKNDFFDKKLPDNKKLAQLFSIIPVGLLISMAYTFEVYNIKYSFGIVVTIITIALYQLFIFTRKRRSLAGQELYAKWKSYNEYLLESDALRTYNMSSVDFWEYSIVYATTFGFADKVMEQLQVKFPMTSEMAQESKFLGVGYGHSGYRYGSFSRTMSRSYRTARVSSRTNSYTSSSGRSSGGFSGGSFGGGGGGGRSR